MESCHWPGPGVLESPPEVVPLCDDEHAPITGTLCLATTQPCAQAFGVISVVSKTSTPVSTALAQMRDGCFVISFIQSLEWLSDFRLLIQPRAKGVGPCVRVINLPVEPVIFQHRDLSESFPGERPRDSFAAEIPRRACLGVNKLQGNGLRLNEEFERAPVRLSLESADGFIVIAQHNQDRHVANHIENQPLLLQVGDRV